MEANARRTPEAGYEARLVFDDEVASLSEGTFGTVVEALRSLLRSSAESLREQELADLDWEGLS